MLLSNNDCVYGTTASAEEGVERQITDICHGRRLHGLGLGGGDFQESGTPFG